MQGVTWPRLVKYSITNTCRDIFDGGNSLNPTLLISADKGSPFKNKTNTKPFLSEIWDI